MAIFGNSRKKKAKSSQSKPLAQPASTSTLQTLHSQQAPQLPPRVAPPNALQYPQSSPQCWGVTSPPPYPQYQQLPYQQVYVSNYYLQPAPQQSQSQLVPQSQPEKKTKRGLISASVNNLPNMLHNDVCAQAHHQFHDGITSWQRQGTQMLCQSAALYDQISSKLNNVLTLIDADRFSGDERELWLNHPPGPQWQVAPVSQVPQTQVARGLKDKNVREKGRVGKDEGCPIVAAAISSNYFAKVNLYANSRLPADLPQFKLYMATFPLLCLAAQYSETVYNKASGKERETYVDADWRNGTKAMVIKSVPKDDMNTIVFAVRGSQTFLDWAVNLNSAPTSPSGFLDDPGNFCHAGFLSVARKMIKPVAARLRQLLTENPNRSSSSLVITGHSAGGAVAALLYSHMLASSSATESELNVLTGCFKRIHCITFGAPPVSLLPLQKPESDWFRRGPGRKSLFLSFVNEGDPVARADIAYVRSLLDLYASPAPSINSAPSKPKPLLAKGKNASSMTLGRRFGNASMSLMNVSSQPQTQQQQQPTWKVPPSTLSNAGRLILLRSVRRVDANAGQGGKRRKDKIEMMDDGVQARGITDEMLRTVVWGDPVCHMMKLYARRIEVLATNAVIGRV